MADIDADAAVDYESTRDKRTKQRKPLTRVAAPESAHNF